METQSLLWRGGATLHNRWLTELNQSVCFAEKMLKKMWVWKTYLEIWHCGKSFILMIFKWGQRCVIFLAWQHITLPMWALPTPSHFSKKCYPPAIVALASTHTVNSLRFLSEDKVGWAVSDQYGKRNTLGRYRFYLWPRSIYSMNGT